MKIKTWMKWYRKILKDFGFKQEEDEKSAKYLNKFLEKHCALNLDDLPHSNTAIVCGAGPSIEKHVKIVEKIKSKGIVIAADGATTALLNEEIIPDIIVTDLDGYMPDIIKANKLGSVVVVHSHGDNLKKLKKYLPKLKNIMGTTQSKPLKNVYNFGGFTDGDRAVFLAIKLGAKKIILAGMDFGEKITKYSRPKLSRDVEEADEIKKLKLKYAEKLIEWIVDNKNVEIKKLG